MKKTIYLLLLSALGFSGCHQENTNWSINVDGVTSSSSCRTTDLNGDGILDIVMGAGADEWSSTPFGVIALDGATGKMLWSVKASNQIVGTPVFIDINKDEIPDVVVGGRSAELIAINGKTGDVFWRFFEGKNPFSARNIGLYNFYNPIFVKDQDKDGIEDLVICNGGDALIPAGALHRPPGKMLLISTKTGKILFQALMPDLKETYFSPVCLDCDTNPNPQIIFGSGGESKSGHLYLCKLSDLKSGNLTKAILLDSSLSKGYEAPPVLADFNHDSALDILFNSVEGTTRLLDGKTFKPLWTVKSDSSEVFSQPAVGYFTGNDKILDVFVNFAVGVYPTYKYTKQLLIDGYTGKVVQRFNNQRFTYSSPLTFDVNSDGTDDVVMNMVKDSVIGNKMKPFYELSIFDFKNNTSGFLAKRYDGACFASTPFLGDLDADNKLDVVYSGSPAIISEFPGNTSYQKPLVKLSVHRLEIEDKSPQKVRWGSYMGKDAKSILR